MSHGDGLAVATQSFNSPSETFVCEHIRTVSPGSTVLLCNDPKGADQFGIPFLSGMDGWSPAPLLGRKVTNGLFYRWRQHFYPGIMPRERRRAVAFLSKYKPVALLAEYGPTGLLISQACREANVPLYVHYHGYDASRLLHYAHTVRHYRRLFNDAAGIIAPSRYLADRLAKVGCPEAKLFVVPCGVDVPSASSSRRTPGLIAAVGRLTDKKAPHHTIGAFAEVSRIFPNARLEMVGDGPLAAQCEALIERYDLREKIELHGARAPSFVRDLLERASIFVQHSVTAPDGDTEGLPVAILEAMANGIPVVSTRHSGIPEAVVDGLTGLLVAENDVRGMASAIVNLLSDVGTAAAMGAAGRARALANFTRERSRDALRDILGLNPKGEERDAVPSPKP